MAINESGVASVSLADIAAEDVQRQLTDGPVLINTVTNLSSKVGKGKKSILIPRVSGMSANDIPDNGTQSTSSGMTLGGDNLILNNKREVADYLYDTAYDSMVDAQDAFFQNAPGVLIEDMEGLIYAELDGASASTPDHIIQMTGAGFVVPELADIRLAGKLLDEQKVPQGDRYLAVTPAIKHAILAFTEVSDASKYGKGGATENGVIAELYGFKIVMSNQVTANTMVAYHKSALAFAFQKEVTPVIQRLEDQACDFVALRAHYGQKVLNSGKYCVLFNATGS